MKINDRCRKQKPHITAEGSSATSLPLITSDVSVWRRVQRGGLTTSRMSLLTSKLGFFFTLRMTQLWITLPPHSTCRLGEVTLASWKLFRLRTPHAMIWEIGQERKVSLLSSCSELLPSLSIYLLIMFLINQAVVWAVNGANYELINWLNVAAQINLMGVFLPPEKKKLQMFNSHF